MSDLTHALEKLLSTYPQTVRLTDGSEADVRLLGREDREPIVAFARSLPKDDLLFLRVDISEPQVVENWIANVEAGVTLSIVAYDDEGVAGYATIDRNPARWMRRVGEIRVNVAPRSREKHLGRHLTTQIFDFARALGLKKLMANMTVDQAGAQAAFKRLGFTTEAVLANHVEDPNGELRDLVIMSYDVDGFTDQADEPIHL